MGLELKKKWDHQRGASVFDPLPEPAQGSSWSYGVRSRLAVLLAVVGLVLVVAACGTDAQTLKPYTQAEGVNVDVGNSFDLETVVHVRNLLIISDEPGSGVLSASLVAGGRDELTGLTGHAINPDGSEGAPLTVTLANTLSLASRAMVVLTDQPPIVVTSPDLAPGLTASMTLTFAKVGTVTVIVPVVDGTKPRYVSITPAPTTST